MQVIELYPSEFKVFGFFKCQNNAWDQLQGEEKESLKNENFGSGVIYSSNNSDNRAGNFHSWNKII